MHPIWNLVSALTARQVYTRVKTRSNAIYLTFDDGPDPDHTPRLLDFLARFQVRATFFLQGDRAERHGDIVMDLVARGHTLGNHSYSHASFANIDIQQQIEEIQRTDVLLKSFDGHDRHVFRPPYGRLSVKTIALCAWRRQRVALWTHDSEDYRLTAPEIVDRLTNLKLQPGDMILFHDDGMSCLDALEALLPRWRDSGFEFAAL